LIRLFGCCRTSSTLNNFYEIRALLRLVYPDCFRLFTPNQQFDDAFSIIGMHVQFPIPIR